MKDIQDTHRRCRELLVRATLLPTDLARDAWKTVQTEFPITEIDDFHITRLLPAVYSRFETSDLFNDGERDRLRSITQRAEARFARQLVAFQPLVKALFESGQQIRLFKGMAFYSQTEPKMSPVRVMADIDLFVPTAQLPNMLSLFEAVGWQVEHVDSLDLHYFFETVARHPTAVTVDIHWHCIQQLLDPTIDNQIWDTAVTSSIFGYPVEIPCPSTSLFLVLANACRDDRYSDHWKIDAAHLLQREVIDWERFCDLVIGAHLISPIRDKLRLLNTIANLVPTPVIKKLDKAPLAVVEKVEQLCRRYPALREPGYFLALFLRVDFNGPEGCWPYRFVCFLKHQLRITYWRSVPYRIVRKVISVIRPKKTSVQT